jgi:hypothetical protein
MAYDTEVDQRTKWASAKLTGDSVTLAREEIWSLCYQLAGAVSVPFLKANPQMAMPTDELSECVHDLLAEFGIDNPPPGYERPSERRPASNNNQREIAS